MLVSVSVFRWESLVYDHADTASGRCGDTADVPHQPHYELVLINKINMTAADDSWCIGNILRAYDGADADAASAYEYASLVWRLLSFSESADGARIQISAVGAMRQKAIAALRLV